MKRRVFFSFHYERDVWRANVVKNSGITQDFDTSGFFNASLEEEAKTKGDLAVKGLIDEALVGVSVVAVLIGAETASRKYVLYEIEKARTLKKGLLGIYVNDIPNQNKSADSKGANPFEKLYIEQPGIFFNTRTYYSQFYRTYSWTRDNGYANLSAWCNLAAKAAGR